MNVTISTDGIVSLLQFFSSMSWGEYWTIIARCLIFIILVVWPAVYVWKTRTFEGQKQLRKDVTTLIRLINKLIKYVWPLIRKFINMLKYTVMTIYKHMSQAPTDTIWRFITSFFLLYLLFAVPVVEAHPGRTDSYGCHTCRTNCPSWGLSYGEYHCHGGYTGGYTGSSYVAPKIYQFPQINATWEWTPNSYSQTFTVKVTLDDPSPSRYSAILSQYAGGDPGPLVDFTSPVFTFYDVTPGSHYLNVKKEINGYWSTVAYWTLEVPEWHPPQPTATPTPEITIQESSVGVLEMSPAIISLLIAGGLSYMAVKGS